TDRPRSAHGHLARLRRRAARARPSGERGATVRAGGEAHRAPGREVGDARPRRRAAVVDAGRVRVDRAVAADVDGYRRGAGAAFVGVRVLVAYDISFGFGSAGDVLLLAVDLDRVDLRDDHVAVLDRAAGTREPLSLTVGVCRGHGVAVARDGHLARVDA